MRSPREAGAQPPTPINDEVRRRCLRAVMDCYLARPGPDQIAYLDQLCAAAMNFAAPGPMGQEMISGLDLLCDAHRIRARTLVLTGELDVRVASEHMHQIAGVVPTARLVRLPHLGHLIHAEDPREWTETISDFPTFR